LNLRIPGPTPCPPFVLEAMAQPMINHRGPEFVDLLQRVTERLKLFFQTKGDVFAMSGSGTGGLECGIVNFLSPGDRVLFVINGSFGDRFAEIGRAFGIDGRTLNFEWGMPDDPAAIDQALTEDPGIYAVYVTHNETSTGITSDLQGIAQVVRKHDKLLVVDAVSSLSCVPLATDDWGCDVVITGSQKGWMIPPGLTMISVSERGWEYHSRARIPRFFWDVGSAKKFLARGETPFTPAVSLYYGLDVALERMAQEGLEAVFERHRRVGERMRQGAKALGLSLLASDERYASNTVTAINGPEGVNVGDLLKRLRERHDIVLASGQGKLTGKIFRVGHLGFVDLPDIEAVLAGLQEELGTLVRQPLSARQPA